MQIDIKGKSSITKKEVRHAVQYFASKLMRSDLLKTITIDIEFVSLKGPYKAYCSYLDNNIRPRMFNINVNNNMSKWSIIKALAHEMVHVKQYAKGELQDYITPKKTDLVKWKGKKFTSSDDWENYWMSPWEIEAYGLEVGLYETYRIHLDNSK
jgi:hypothetical protein